MSKKSHIPEGFEDFVESMNEDGGEGLTKHSLNSDRFNSFELYSFLEQEVQRLEKILQLHEENAYVLEHFSQHKALLELKQAENMAQVLNLLEHFCTSDHPFFNQLEKTFNDCFSDSK